MSQFINGFGQSDGEGVNVSVWVMIRRARELKGIGQAEIAKVLDISQASYSRFENGESKASIDRVSKICVFLGLKLTVEFMPSGFSFVKAEYKQ